MKNFSRFKMLLIQLGLFTIFLTMNLTASSYFNPIFHSNGSVAWNGYLSSSFYHDNGQMAWGGPEFSDCDCYFDNGEKAWSGLLRKECPSYSIEKSYIFHRNQQIAWRGALRKECSSFMEACYIYHTNGTIAWRGALRKECSSFMEACYAYHANGTIAWRGALRKECSSFMEACYIYHTNGAIAWKNAFVIDNANLSLCGLYYDNGQLAWSGKRGDPLFDQDGNKIAKSAEAINLPLGENSWLYVSSNGYSILYLSMGDGSFLSFSNQNENPILSMHLGTGFDLLFFPHTGENPQLSVYGKMFEMKN